MLVRAEGLNSQISRDFWKPSLQRPNASLLAEGSRILFFCYIGRNVKLFKT